MRCGYHVRWRLGRVVLRQSLLGQGRHLPHGLHRRHLRRRRRLRCDGLLHAAGTLFRASMRFHDDFKCRMLQIRDQVELLSVTSTIFIETTKLAIAIHCRENHSLT